MSTRARPIACSAFVLGLGLAAAWPMMSCKKTDNAQVKVLGGKADDSSFPQTLLVLLFDGNKKALGSCTGSFIRHDTLITAAHCIKEINAMYVEIVSPTGQFKDHPVYSNSITLHPMYNPGGSITEVLSSDIAVIHFAPKTAPDNLVVTLASKPPKAGDVVSLVGFGQSIQDSNASALNKRVGTNIVALTPAALGTAVVAIRHSGTTDDGNAATYYGDSGGIIYDKSNNGVAIVHDHVFVPAGSVNQVVSATNAIKSAALLDAGTGTNGASSTNGAGSTSTGSGTANTGGTAITATGDDIVDRWVSFNDPSIVQFISQQLGMPNTIAKNLDGAGLENVNLPFAATAPAPMPAAGTADGSNPDDGRWYDPFKPGVSFPYCKDASSESKDNPGWGFEAESCKIK